MRFVNLKKTATHLCEKAEWDRRSVGSSKASAKDDS